MCTQQRAWSSRGVHICTQQRVQALRHVSRAAVHQSVGTGSSCKQLACLDRCKPCLPSLPLIVRCCAESAAHAGQS